MPKGWRRQLVRSIAAALAFAGAALAVPVEAAEFFAGDYSFSDELGGFRLISASGTGTRDDPFVVREELVDVVPVTLVIRNRAFGATSRRVGMSEITLEKQVVNRSRRVWSGFELELQEVLGKPSTYGDGLSFKQFASEAPDVSSDVFSKNERLFEPYDRIEFQEGHVDDEAAASFRVVITDPTPVREYYLLQDPKLLSAGLPHAGASYAAR